MVAENDKRLEIVLADKLYITCGEHFSTIESTQNEPPLAWILGGVKQPSPCRPNDRRR